MPHSILIHKGNIYNVDEILGEMALAMGSEDVYLISANSIDS